MIEQEVITFNSKEQAFAAIEMGIEGYKSWVRDQRAIAISNEWKSDNNGEEGFHAIISGPSGLNEVFWNQEQRNMYSGKLNLPSEFTTYFNSLLEF